MKKLVIGLCFIVFGLALIGYAQAAYAQDSGLFYNPERDGEGITMTRSGDKVVMFFFTYEPHPGCWNVELPDDGLVNEYNCHEQRWFFSSGDVLTDGEQAEGWLYTTFGLDYDECVADAQNPFFSRCGEAHIVGRFLMERYNNGWRMIVIPFGEILDSDDPLYHRVYEFQSLLFKATD